MSQYNNQHPYYNFQQHTAGPPQPQWQSGPPRRGWGDPRLSLSSPVAPSPTAHFDSQSYPNQNAQQHIPPPPPPPPGGFPSASQNPSQYDTSSWGVRYNQNPQYNNPNDALRPPLPPRPPSAAGGYDSQWNGQQYTKPPTPPPRPAEYTVPQQPSQDRYYPHDQYSHRPSSHQYEPSTSQWNQQPSQPAPSAPPNWSQAYHQNESVVPQAGQDAHGWQTPSGAIQESQQKYTQPAASPQIGSIPKPSASALGAGGPSDWEHFPGDDHYYQSQSEPQQQQHEQQQQQHRPSVGSGQPGMVSTPEPIHAVPKPTSPDKLRRTSTPGSQLQQHQSYAHELSQRLTPQHGHSASLSSLSSSGYYNQGRTDSTVSSAPQSALQRTGTIDSVIHAWNSQGSHSGQNQANIEPLKSSRPASALRQTVPRVETASTETQTDFPPIVKTEIKVETREMNPYEDLKNEYRTSLNRYATMLRQEIAATEEAEKLKIVTDFVTREVKLRSILFNVEPSELIRSNELAELKRNQEDLLHLRKSQEEYRKDLEHSRQDLATTRQQRDDLKLQRDDINKQKDDLNNQKDNLQRQNDDFKHQLEEMKKDLEQSRSEIVDLKATAAKKREEEIMTIPANSNRAVTPRPVVNTAAPSQTSSKEDSFVMIGADGEDVEYSPGGRPKMAMAPRTPSNDRSFSPPLQGGPVRNHTPYQSIARPSSPGANAPMTLDDYVTPGKPVGIDRSFTPNPMPPDRPGTGAPVEPRQPAPIPFQPARPAYTPFRYGESLESTHAMVNPDHPVNEAYMKLRHEQAAESGRLLSQEPPSLTVTPAPDRGQTATPSRARQQHEEAFLGLLRQQSKVTKKPSLPMLGEAPAPLRAGTPLKRRQSIPPLIKTAESLRQCLPNSINQLTFAKQSHPKIAPISTSVVRVADDFGFIHGTVVGWDKENRQLRQRLDAERAARESETQAHIDSLFNDNEIGYADIAGLEEDSKLEEASKKYEEDQQELESFTRNVFDVVTQRLEGEVAQLDALRVKTLEVLDQSAQSAQSASSRVRMAVAQPQKALEGAPLVDTMTTLLQIYQKIDVRYTKIAEAHFERERRRKRLELSVLYVNGDTAGVKKLEKDFDKAQSMQMLSEARKRDDRANKLMDSFDRAVVRGLSENQEWVDDMTNRASLLRDLVLSADSNGHGPSPGPDRDDLLYGPSGITASMSLLQDAVGIVMQDSRDLVTMSTQADKILNEADFAMFLAEAKIAASDEKEFDKLNHEKTKEDQKLKEEAEARMRSVIKGPEEILGFVKDVTDTLGHDGGHRARLNQALEQAKKRNMTPSPAPGQGQGPVSPLVTEQQQQQLTPPPLNPGRPTMREV